jgi:hypothetical protein
LQLTTEQVETAKAQGCRFIAASDAQVRQFAMQRRVFQIDGQPFLAARQDGFYETAGTLIALIADAIRQREDMAPPAPAFASDENPGEVNPGGESPSEDNADDDSIVDDSVGRATDEAPDETSYKAEPRPRVARKPRLVRAEPAPDASAGLDMFAALPAEDAVAEPGMPAGPPRQVQVLSAMATIAKGYGQGHELDAGQLSALLETVHRSLRGLA